MNNTVLTILVVVLFSLDIFLLWVCKSVSEAVSKLLSFVSKNADHINDNLNLISETKKDVNRVLDLIKMCYMEMEGGPH